MYGDYVCVHINLYDESQLKIFLANIGVDLDLCRVNGEQEKNVLNLLLESLEKNWKQ